jgi:hypothetical protein
MRTTLSLDPDVYEAARTLADASGENLGVVVSALVRKGLTAERDFSAKNGLPIFQVPNDAPSFRATSPVASSRRRRRESGPA